MSELVADLSSELSGDAKLYNESIGIANTDAWQVTVAKVQRYRDASLERVQPPVPALPRDLPFDVSGIPRTLLTTHEVELTESSPEKLLKSLANGQVTSVEVTSAFLRRSVVAQRLVNCITELLPERALARARVLDEYYARHKRPIGSLHGLPISVKEHLNMKDLDVNTSLCSWVGNKQKDDCALLKLLWQAGAVFYARTTQPQTIMHLETSSNLYGVTVNPFNRNLTAGGSSGGEGALLGLRGSCLGIGSDIGGSIRSPAANNGVYGLRPTTCRLPLEGAELTMGGMEQIVGVFGPFSTSIEGIKRFMEAVLAPRPWLTCPSVVPIPWRCSGKSCRNPATLRVQLKIGVIWDDEIVKPHPPVIRALTEVVDKLKDVDGVEIVDFKPLRHDLGWEIISALFFGDGGDLEKQGINASGEPWRPLSHWIINENPHVRHLDISEVWHRTNQREAFRKMYAEHWTSTATGVDSAGVPTGMVDVILCPVGPGAAPPLECAKYWLYTSTWNLLDYPALVFPVTTVDPQIDHKDKSYKPRNAQDQYNYDLYEPDTYANAPVSLQLVGRRFEDEKVIEAFEIMQPYLGDPNS